MLRSISARGHRIRTSKRESQACALYYGGSAAAAKVASARGADFIDLGVAESYPTLGPILEAEGVVFRESGAVEPSAWWARGEPFFA